MRGWPGKYFARSLRFPSPVPRMTCACQVHNQMKIKTGITRQSLWVRNCSNDLIPGKHLLVTFKSFSTYNYLQNRCLNNDLLSTLYLVLRQSWLSSSWQHYEVAIGTSSSDRTLQLSEAEKSAQIHLVTSRRQSQIHAQAYLTLNLCN